MCRRRVSMVCTAGAGVGASSVVPGVGAGMLGVVIAVPYGAIGSASGFGPEGSTFESWWGSGGGGE